jgi:hypothetical protein
VSINTTSKLLVDVGTAGEMYPLEKQKTSPAREFNATRFGASSV